MKIPVRIAPIPLRRPLLARKPPALITPALLTVALLLSLSASPLAAQHHEPPTATGEAMQPMSWWIGRWEGSGWSMGPDRQRREVTVVEIVEPKIDGQVLVFEGIGTDPETGTVGHHALGVLSYDASEERYAMWTYRSGDVLHPEVEVSDDGTLVWSFAQGPGRVRFTVRHGEGDRWVEVGEFSPDGEQWYPMFGMDLGRVD